MLVEAADGWSMRPRGVSLHTVPCTKEVKTCDDRPPAVVTLYVSPKVARHAVSRLHGLCMLDAGALQISWQHLGNPLFLF